MAKKKIEVDLYTYGLYTEWERDSKKLPKIKKITTEIPAAIGIEFGYILKIKKAKGKKITFRIDHPPFTDDEGNIRPSFEGEYYINSNDYEFFLGDTIWEPLHDKLGDWTMITWIDGLEVANKTLNLYDSTIDN